MKFTTEEIALCKKIWERQNRKDIEYGDWLLNEGGFAKVWPYRYRCKRIDVIPLWQISDCLEFLQEKVGIVELWRTARTLRWICRLRDGKSFSAKTPLEACLKAVLAILEEIK